MTAENVTGAITELAGKVGELVGSTKAMGGELRELREGTADTLRDHARRIDDLERRNDQEDGAAAAALKTANDSIGRLDRRFKILGAFLGVIGIVEPVLIAVVLK